jgi:hypothetical protein
MAISLKKLVELEKAKAELQEHKAVEKLILAKIAELEKMIFL